MASWRNGAIPAISSVLLLVDIWWQNKYRRTGLAIGCSSTCLTFSVLKDNNWNNTVVANSVQLSSVLFVGITHRDHQRALSPCQRRVVSILRWLILYGQVTVSTQGLIVSFSVGSKLRALVCTHLAYSLYTRMPLPHLPLFHVGFHIFLNTKPWPEEDGRTSGTGVTVSCEPPGGIAQN